MKVTTWRCVVLLDIAEDRAQEVGDPVNWDWAALVEEYAAECVGTEVLGTRSLGGMIEHIGSD